MAGGAHAEHIPCPICLSEQHRLTKAVRTYEGDETDEYQCEAQHTFGVDWAGGPAEASAWPPSPEVQAYVAAQRQQPGRRG